MEWDSTDSESLTDEQLQDVLAGKREIADGESVDGEELFRRLKL